MSERLSSFTRRITTQLDRQVRLGGFCACLDKIRREPPPKIRPLFPGQAPIIEGQGAHTKHQEPFNCCSEWVVWGEGGSSIEPRLMPDEAIPLLRFGYPKSKEKPLRLDKNGNVLSMSLTATRRMSEETAKIFEELF